MPISPSRRSIFSAISLLLFSVPVVAQVTNTVSVVAGLAKQQGYSGDGGLATKALLQSPFASAIGPDGTVYVVDRGNQVIRAVAPKTGFISTYAGGGSCTPTANLWCGDGQIPTKAVLDDPTAVAFLGSDVLIADWDGAAIRRVSATTGLITSILGTTRGGVSTCVPDYGDTKPCMATDADISPYSIAVDAANGFIYMADVNANVIFKLNLSTSVVTEFAGVYQSPSDDGHEYSGDGGQASKAHLNSPTQIALDGSGNLFIADAGNNVVRVINLASGVINTAAGTSVQSFSGDGGKAKSATLNTPQGVAFDNLGNLYIADTANNRIRLVDSVSGLINTVAGSSAVGCVLQTDSLGDGCVPPALADMSAVTNLTVDANNYVYVADGLGGTIRKFPVLAAAPVFNPPSGSFATTPYITITDITPGASIYYTLDGTTPTSKSAPYLEPVAIPYGATTLQAIAVAAGYANSLVTSAVYNVGVAAPSAPVFSIPPATYIGYQTITLTDATNGAVIYYSVDGSYPTIAYTGPITVTATTTVKAVAVLQGYAFSGVSGGVYTITFPITTPAVTVTPSPATITVNQTVSVMVTVAGPTNLPGAYPGATGSIKLTSGNYASAMTTLAAGTVTVSIPGGSLAAGTDTLTATYAPDSASASIFNSTTGTGSVRANLLTPTLTFAIASQTYPTAPFLVSATSTSPGALTYKLVSGPATVSTGGTVTLTGTGTVTVEADQSATSTYASASKTAAFTVTSASATPVITFSIPNHTFGDASFTISATSNSPGAILYSVMSGSATVSGNMVTLTGAGNVTVLASQAASGTYSAATQPATFTVAQATPAITWNPGTHVLYTGLRLSGILNAQASVAGALTYTAAVFNGPTNAVTSSTTLAAGTYTLTASFVPTDTADYTSTAATQSVTVVREHVWVVNTGGTVSALDAGGNSYTPSPAAGGSFGIAIDNSGNIWSVNATGSSLSEFSSSGAVLAANVIGGGLASANALAIDGSGYIWVVNANNSVSLFSNSGTALSPSGGFIGGGLNTPNAIAIDNSGSVWVTNSGTGTVTRMLGAAAPVAPLVTGVTNNTLGAKP